MFTSSCFLLGVVFTQVHIDCILSNTAPSKLPATSSSWCAEKHLLPPNQHVLLPSTSESHSCHGVLYFTPRTVKKVSQPRHISWLWFLHISLSRAYKIVTTVKDCYLVHCWFSGCLLVWLAFLNGVLVKLDTWKDEVYQGEQKETDFRDSQLQLSVWWDLEPLRRWASAHACEGLFWPE